MSTEASFTPVKRCGRPRCPSMNERVHTHGMFSHGPRDDILVNDGLHTQRRSHKGTTEPNNAYCLVTSQPSRGPRATRACGAAAGNRARAHATAGAGRATWVCGRARCDVHTATRPPSDALLRARPGRDTARDCARGECILP